MTIIIPILICLAIAAVCAIILTVSNVLFGVEEDPTYLAVRDALPGANCGACGFSGCDGYAKALSEGKIAETNLCVPGGAAAANDIAAALGVEAAEVVRRVAFVGCNGTCEATKRDEKGLPPASATTCKEAAANWEGEGVCINACIGLGDCVAVCPEQAIVLKDGIAKVISSDCLGCGLCAKTCPHGVIRIMKAENTVAVSCSNHDKGALTRKMCSNGCIGCTKCVRTCPNGAISMDNNLAVIDYEKCTNCGACAEACPVGAIHNSAFICDKCL